MGATFSRPATAVFRGLAQLTFADGTRAGLLVLAGLALIAPWSAAGAVAGATFATAVGYFGSAYSREDWTHGLAGFNGAIIGILWGGSLAEGAFNVPLFLTVLSLCVALEFVLRKALARLALPALSMPAVATAILVSLALAAPGTWFWADTPASPFGKAGALVALACFVAAMVTKSASAAGWAVLLAAVAYLAVWSRASDPFAYGGLWAVTVPLAGFSVPAVFVREPIAGLLGGALAAAAGAAIWLLWMNSAAVDAAPPLLAPFILGVWLAIAAMRRLGRAPVLQPSFWRTAAAIHRAGLAGGSTVAVEGGDALEPALASGSSSGNPLPNPAESHVLCEQMVRSSLACRQAFWSLCDRLRAAAQGAGPAALHRALADFERRAPLRATISLDVAGGLRAAGAERVIDLYGRLDTVACLDCSFSGDWPPGEIWRHCDLRCPRCSGPLRPALHLFDKDPPAAVGKAVEGVLADCAVLLVPGGPVKDARVDAILDRVRAAGGIVVFLNEGAPCHALAPEDLVIAARPSLTLRALSAVLGALGPFAPVSPAARRHRVCG